MSHCCSGARRNERLQSRSLRKDLDGGERDHSHSFPARRWGQRLLRLQLAWSRRTRGSRPGWPNRPWCRRGPGRYDVYMRAQILVFRTQRNQGPSRIDGNFLYHYPDVQHGFLIERTNVNLMVLPGHVSKTTARFDEPGEYRFFCHEYCGIAHHTMFGKVVVEPRS